MRNSGNERPWDAENTALTEELFSETLLTVRFRGRDEIATYFGNFELVEPGLVPLDEWRPSSRACQHEYIGDHSCIGGVARKAAQRRQDI